MIADSCRPALPCRRHADPDGGEGPLPRGGSAHAGGERGAPGGQRPRRRAAHARPGPRCVESRDALTCDIIISMPGCRLGLRVSQRACCLLPARCRLAGGRPPPDARLPGHRGEWLPARTRLCMPAPSCRCCLVADCARLPSRRRSLWAPASGPRATSAPSSSRRGRRRRRGSTPSRATWRSAARARRPSWRSDGWPGGCGSCASVREAGRSGQLYLFLDLWPAGTNSITE